MLVAMVLDRPVADAQALVQNQDAFVAEIIQTLIDKMTHPMIERMLAPDVHDAMPPPQTTKQTSAAASSSATPLRLTQNHAQRQ